MYEVVKGFLLILFPNFVLFPAYTLFKVISELVHAAPDALGALSRAEEARALAPHLEQDSDDEDDGDEHFGDAQGCLHSVTPL